MALFGRKEAVASAPSTQKGERIYAIGDVHGRFDLLRQLLQQIEEHSAAQGPCKDLHVLQVGDLVDRGPNSAEVVRFVHDVSRRSDRLIVLMGNHEEIMLKALDGDLSALRAWLRVGGVETLKSFGFDPPADDEDPRAFVAKVRASVTPDLLAWLRTLPLTARSGDYLFCHAGVRPGVPLHRQSRADLLWIRDEFLHDEETRHGAMIVHGHSVSEQVEERSNRIGIDTGAYRTGVLTAIYLEGTRREILVARGDPDPSWRSASRPASGGAGSDAGVAL